MAKILTGTVTGIKMANTLVVEKNIKKLHPLYKKVIIKTIKLKVHYNEGSYKIGDIVEIQETKPISKTKNWIVIKKVDK